MTSAPIRNALADHLRTPQNSAPVLIDYQPSQLAALRSMDHDLLVKSIVSAVKAAKLFGEAIQATPYPPPLDNNSVDAAFCQVDSALDHLCAALGLRHAA